MTKVVKNPMQTTDKTRKALYLKYAGVWIAAHEAAANAQSGMVENTKALNCGFAWVQINPGTEPFVRWCKAMHDYYTALSHDVAAGHAATEMRAKARSYGAKGYPGGWQFWCPGSFNGQEIGIHEAGAKAFRDVLAHSLQIRDVTTGSRLD